MLRRFLLAVAIFLLIVVVAADRVGALVAAHVLAGKVQTDENLRNRPTASIKGIPFLTQAFGGTYHDVHITAHDVLVSQVPVTTLTVELHGLHLPLSKAVHGSVSQVPVDRVTGTAFVSFADANSYLAHHALAGSSIRIAPGPDSGTASIVDRVRLGGQHFALRGNGRIAVSGNVVSVDVSGLRAGATSVAPKLLSQALTNAAISFPLRTLPFQLNLTSVTVTPTGLLGAGSADDVVLGLHQ